MANRLVEKVKNNILNNHLTISIITLSKKIILPGFEKTPLYDVSVFFFKGLANGAITMRASSMAFSFFLAVFPSIIFFFTLIPYIPIPNFQEELILLLERLMPEAAFETTETTITEIVTKQNGGLLSLGFLSALYFSTNGFNSMLMAFNNTYHEVETRKPIRQRVVCVLLVFITTVLLISATSLAVFAEYVVNTYADFFGSLAHFLILFGELIIVAALFFFNISCIYYFGPANKRKFKFFSAGSTFATLLSLLTSVGFAYYVNHFGQYNKLYGSIGTLIVILLWIYINSLVLLLGYELNASIHSAKKPVINN